MRNENELDNIEMPRWDEMRKRLAQTWGVPGPSVAHSALCHGYLQLGAVIGSEEVGTAEPRSVLL